MRDTFAPTPLLFRFLMGLLGMPEARLHGLKHIHSPDDTLERADPQAMEQTTDLAEAYIREVEAAS